jgi:hypothetical protein
MVGSVFGRCGYSTGTPFVYNQMKGGIRNGKTQEEKRDSSLSNI